MSRLKGNNKFWFFVKLIVSLGLIAYLIWMVDWGRAVKTVRQADKLLILMAPFCWWFGLGFASLRWQLVLADSQVSFSFRQAYKAYIFGAFYSIFLPGVIGGDAVRIGLCVRQTRCHVGTGTTSVLLERMAGVFVLLSFLLGVSLLFPTTFSSLIAVESPLSVTAIAVIGMLVMTGVLLGRRMWGRWLPSEDARGVAALIRSGMQAFCALKTRTLGMVLILSALFQAMDIVTIFLLSQAIGLSLSLPIFFAVNPLVYLVTVLPISLGGLGVREGTLVFLLAQYGVTASDAVMLSFLVYLNRIVVGSAGGIWQLLEILSHKQACSVVKESNVFRK